MTSRSSKLDAVEDLAIRALTRGERPTTILVSPVTYADIYREMVNDRRMDLYPPQGFQKLQFYSSAGALDIKHNDEVPDDIIIVTDAQTYREYLNNQADNILLGLDQ